MSTRFPPTPTAQLPQEYQEYSAPLNTICKRLFGENGSTIIYKDQNGGLGGPFPILIASKEIGRDVNALLNTSFKKFPPLSLEVKEVVILSAAGHHQAAYEMYAHGEIAKKRVGLSEEQIGAVCEGRKPEGLSEAAGVAFELAQYLVRVPGALPDELYMRAVEVLGKESMLLVVHYVAIYSWFCMLMNVADVPKPE